ncbi:hypothetical protein BDV96DRAFT_13901 [Lophiotrema nucula]|uniref:Uncharacterized protein n=1 Tax=Lophiotrema nucula TaxID=690887 RepID=A0A6A5ZTQ9_9PLEO|nr:hypothetical protein BDV96DRAFT_13901 [Lophiotrema nucula]
MIELVTKISSQDMGDLAQVISSWNNAMLLPHRFRTIEHLRGLYHHVQPEKRTLALSSLLFWTTQMECSVPSDRVFALYGLSTNGTVYPQPDYEKHPY